MTGASGRGRPASKCDEIYRVLRERIEAGEELAYKPGAALPAASTLAIQFGTSAATVGRAVKQLKEEGYLFSSGTGSPPRVRRRPLEGER